MSGVPNLSLIITLALFVVVQGGTAIWFAATMKAQMVSMRVDVARMAEDIRALALLVKETDKEGVRISVLESRTATHDKDIAELREALGRLQTSQQPNRA